MPTRDELIQALQKQPEAQFAHRALSGVSQALGITDAIRVLKGEMTPTEAQDFALTSAIGLIPGAKAEGAAVKTMGELLPHFYPETSMFAKMTPKQYLMTMGERLPKQLPSDLEKVLGPEMPTVSNPLPFEGANKIGGGDIPSGHELWGSLTAPEKQYILDNHADTKMSELPKLVDKISPQLDRANLDAAHKALSSPSDISDEAIDKALTKNPGASIFDVAGTHVEGPSSSYGYLQQTTFPEATFSDIPRMGGVLQTPLAAKILGRSENLVHGTRLGPEQWSTPTGGGAGIGGSQDALKLPPDELGVHFGNPIQAQNFSSISVNTKSAPRQYPVVVQTNNPLRMRDMGSWGQENINWALTDLNNGTINGGYHSSGLESPETVGKFPKDELDQLDSIQDYRDYIHSKGYDSVVYKNGAEDPGHDSYIKFTPSPEAPDYVTGVRSPFAAFDPSKLMRPELAAGIGGAAAITPQVQDYIQALQNGGQQNQ